MNRDDDLKALLDAIGPDDGPDEALDEAWEALALGELDEDGIATLRARAATSPRDSDLLDLHEPLEADVVASVTDRILASRPAEPAPVQFREGAWEVPTEAVPAGATETTTVFATILAWFRQPMLVGPALALAVALLMVLPRAGDIAPTYEVELRSGDHSSRDADDLAPNRAHAPGSRVELVLMPSQAERVQQVSAVLTQAGVVMKLDLETEVAEDGAIRVQSTVPNAMPAGDATLDLRLETEAGVRTVTVPLEVTARR
jgi:hypothetical protein